MLSAKGFLLGPIFLKNFQKFFRHGLEICTCSYRTHQRIYPRTIALMGVHAQSHTHRNDVRHVRVMTSRTHSRARTHVHRRARTRTHAHARTHTHARTRTRPERDIDFTRRGAQLEIAGNRLSFASLSPSLLLFFASFLPVAPQGTMTQCTGSEKKLSSSSCSYVYNF